MISNTNWNLLVNAMLSGFLTGVATRIFVISLPTLANNLETDLAGMSWALIAYPLATVSLSLVFGRVGDLYGRRSVFALGFAIFTAGSFLCGFSQNIFQLCLFRLIQGIGAAMTQSQARALAMEAVPEGAGGRAQGLMTMAHQTGFLLGPGLGGLIIDYIHWRGVFFVLVPIGVISTVLTAKEKTTVLAKVAFAERPLRSSVDYLGATYLIGTTVLLVSVLDRRVIETIPSSWEMLLTLGFFSCLLCFLFRERAASSPILDLSLFKIRMFAVSTVCLLLVSVTHTMTSFILPFYLQEVLGLSPTFMGLLYLAPPITIMALSPLGGYLSDKIGSTIPATVGIAVASAAYVLGGFLMPGSHWALPTAMLALAGVGDGLFSSPNHTAMISAVPKEHRGVATGALQMMFGLGNILGVSLGGFLVTAAFRFYIGNDAANPSPSNPVIFVAALNVVFLTIAGITILATVLSAMRGKPVNRVGEESYLTSPHRR